MAVFYGIQGDVLLGLIATAGPDYSTGGDVADVKLRIAVWLAQPDLVQQPGMEADDCLTATQPMISEAQVVGQRHGVAPLLAVAEVDRNHIGRPRPVDQNANRDQLGDFGNAGQAERPNLGRRAGWSNCADMIGVEMGEKRIGKSERPPSWGKLADVICNPIAGRMLCRGAPRKCFQWSHARDERWIC